LKALVANRSGGEREDVAIELKNLQTYRAGEVARFTTAQANAPLSGTAPAEGRSGAEKAGEAAHRVGDALEDAARKTGDEINDAVR